MPELDPGKVLSPCKGTALYRNPRNGAAVFVVHYSADVLKRDAGWAQRERMLYSDETDWAKEYEIDFHATIRRRAYWAFNPDRNIVVAFKIPEKWPLFLSFDFGTTDPTCVLFYAQNPATSEVVVWHEIYLAQTPTAEISRMVYEALAEERELSAGAMRIEDVIVDAVGDPAGLGYALEYGYDPFPIAIRTKGFKTPWRLNDRKAGEAKVNEAMLPSFVCCGKRWYPVNQEPRGICGGCRKVHDARPLLTFMENRAPNLVRTLPGILRVRPTATQQEAPENNEAVEDHAPDALRYGVMRTLFEIPAEKRSLDVITAPAAALNPHQLLHKVRLTLAMKQQEEILEEDDEDALVIGQLVNEFGPYEDEEAEYDPGLVLAE